MNLTEHANLATITEAAEILEINRRRLEQAIRDGHIPVVKVCRARPGGPARIINLEDVEAWASGGYGQERLIAYKPDDCPREKAREYGIAVRSAERGIQRARKRRAK